MSTSSVGAQAHGPLGPLGPLGQETAVRLLIVSLLVILRRQYQQGTVKRDAGPPPQAHVSRMSDGRLCCDASLQGLPSSLQLTICTFLSAPQLSALAATSLELRVAATDEHLWQQLFACRFDAVLRYLPSLDSDADACLPWRVRYWLWERSWRERVLSQKRDIWAPDPMLLVHGRFVRVSQLLNDHPGGPQLLGDAMALGRDVADIFDFVAHPPRAHALLDKLHCAELHVADTHEPLVMSCAKT
ncbi:hypothetical protein T492DRAFT_1030742 [Pavlovales sp. CCMP2436]|nr:hypothetical protein T492DRAFT_1030742 [Pavlovales sp. CCMP2436]